MDDLFTMKPLICIKKIKFHSDFKVNVNCELQNILILTFHEFPSENIFKVKTFKVGHDCNHQELIRL